MTDTYAEAAAAASDLLATGGTALRALAGAVDDLRRATLILNQLASGTSQAIRGPEDYRRIAGQFADRARACTAAEDALAAVCRRMAAAAQVNPALAPTVTHPSSRSEATMKIHASVTPERVVAAVEREQVTLDNPGFCVCCGTEADGVEPDARRYECEACGEPGVYGASELLIRMGL